jgi:transformation/transcription domain-associated protein
VGDGTPTGTNKQSSKIDSSIKRLYFSRTRELVAAQAKTLSFLTYLLRTFSSELKPYEDRLATNVVALMTTCPRESIGTRKELLVATRHLLNSEFRAGFYRHIDPMLDERLLMGTTSHNNRPDPTMIRPLAYTTLSDFVQHVRTLLSMSQMSRVVCLFSRILHDASLTLPLTTQYTAVRTLLSVIDLIFHNKDSDAQLGRDMLVRMLDTLVDKLQALTDYFPEVVVAERKREAMEGETLNYVESPSDANPTSWLLNNHQNLPDSVRDVQSMIRAIIVGQKTIIYYISSYRSQRAELASKDGSPATIREHAIVPPTGSNEEVSSAMLKITNTEIAIIDRYVVTAMSAMKLLTESETGTADIGTQGLAQTAGTNRVSTGEKTLSEQHRDALTYFAAAFTALDGFNLRRSLGLRLDLLVDAIVDDPMVMIIPRHLLGSNATTSYEFCSILLDYLVERMDLLCYPRSSELIFVDEQSDDDSTERQYLRERLHAVTQLPAESDEKLKQRSMTMLQLFERVLKSLSVYPENEAVVRRQLRRIVVVCLRSSMENIGNWPESYCMLLRYVFRSISAGKFEDSYRELLPLIPTVLNGLYRVVCSAEDSVLRSTAIELCLTIPARLSSLLPHMNLLLRVIIPALDSSSGDLVNLGYVARGC